MTDTGHQNDEQNIGESSGPQTPETEGRALFPTEGLAPGEDVEGGRLADLGNGPSRPPESPETRAAKVRTER
jgi:hypothetical protein